MVSQSSFKPQSCGLETLMAAYVVVTLIFLLASFEQIIFCMSELSF